MLSAAAPSTDLREEVVSIFTEMWISLTNLVSSHPRCCPQSLRKAVKGYDGSQSLNDMVCGFSIANEERELFGDRRLPPREDRRLCIETVQNLVMS